MEGLGGRHYRKSSENSGRYEKWLSEWIATAGRKEKQRPSNMVRARDGKWMAEES